MRERDYLHIYIPSLSLSLSPPLYALRKSDPE